MQPSCCALPWFVHFCCCTLFCCMSCPFFCLDLTQIPLWWTCSRMSLGARPHEHSFCWVCPRRQNRWSSQGTTPASWADTPNIAHTGRAILHVRESLCDLGQGPFTLWSRKSAQSGYSASTLHSTRIDGWLVYKVPSVRTLYSTCIDLGSGFISYLTQVTNSRWVQIQNVRSKKKIQNPCFLGLRVWDFNFTAQPLSLGFLTQTSC